MGLESMLACSAGAIGGIILWKYLIEKKLDARAMRGGFIYPRSSTDRFLNGLDYYKGVDYCPSVDLFPEGRFGKISAYFGYYKKRQ